MPGLHVPVIGIGRAPHRRAGARLHDLLGTGRAGSALS